MSDQTGLWMFFTSEAYVFAMILLYQAYGCTDLAGGLALIWSVGTLGGYLTAKWWRR